MSHHHHEKEFVPRIGISIGDINGIGPEVVIKSLNDNRTYSNITPVIYAHSKVLSFYRKQFSAAEFNFQQIKNALEIHPRKVNLINCWTEEVEITPGEPSPQSGSCAFKSLDAAVMDLQENLLDALVTAPIDKQNIQSDDFKFPGHTEYLTEKFGADDSLMFLISENLRVAVVSGHVPISEVASDINKEKIYSKIKLMHESLRRDFGITKPRIAVLGLNPHAGDNGLLGKEEQEIIAPAVKQAFEDKIFAYGPYAADGFFGSSAYKQFDGILAMYHDQGLVPFKALSFGHGVNFTAGLPIVRTSPDHGTAYNIAGKGEASESSFREALFMAHDILMNRRTFDEVHSNPLKYTKLKSDR